MRSKNVTIDIIQLERNPVDGLDLLKPTVKVTMGEKTKEMNANPVACKDLYHGNTLGFIPLKSVTFDRVGSTNQVQLSVEDVDVYGVSSIIATGSFRINQCQNKWWSLSIHPSALDDGDINDGDMQLAIQVSIKIEEKDVLDLKVEGVEEVKESDASDDEKNPPNYFVITVKGIEGLDNKGAQEKKTNSYVEAQCGSKACETPAEEKTLNPKFNHCFFFPLNKTGNPIDKISIMVKNSKVGKDSLISELSIPRDSTVLEKFLEESKGETDMITESILLSPSGSIFKKGDSDKLDCGKLTLGYELKFIDEDDMQYMDENDNGTDAASWRAFCDGEDVASSDEETDDDDDDEDEEEEEKKSDKKPAKKGKEEKEEEEQKRKEEEEKKRKYEEDLAAMQNIEVKPGDYRINVDIIQVQGLKTSADKPPDPVIRVDAYGQRKSTAIKQNRTSAYFNQQMLFELKDMSPEALMNDKIRISCMDAGSNPLVKDSLIGAWQSDFDFVYYKENHEYYRQWVPLMGSAGKHGVSGYLHMSISILGPEDKPAVHDREKEIAEEKKQSGGGMKVDMPTTIQTLHFLVVSIYNAEDLPLTDDNFIDGCGIDAFLSVQFGDCDPQKTKVVKALQKDGMNAKFNEEIWIPYLSPNMSSSISISLYDKENLGISELVASTPNLNLDMIERYPEMFMNKWYSFYGGHVDYPPLKKLEHTEMNKNATSAACYKGRVLMSLRINENKGGTTMKNGKKVKRVKRKNKPKVAPIIGNLSKLLPETHRYGLRFRAFIGSELPMSFVENNFCVEVSIGKYSLRTSTAKADNGICYFDSQELKENLDIILPKDQLTLPDVFIYLVRNPGSKVPPERKLAFVRLNAKEFFNKSKGVISNPQWYELKADPVLDCIRKSEHAGMILVDVQFNDGETLEQEQMKPQEVQETVRVEHQARLFIFQGRNLPSTDSSGSLDPYIKVLFAGQEVRTKVKHSTKNPLYYESAAITVDLPDLRQMPMMIFQVWDHDTFDAHDYIGSKRVAVTDEEIVHYHDASDSTNWSPLENAQWVPLGRIEEGDMPGEILIAVELIKKTEGVDYPALPTKKEMKPPTQTKYLEILSIGCRDLQTENIFGLHKPFVEFTLAEKVIHSTEASSKPSSYSPNFSSSGTSVDHKIVEVKLPINPSFAPALTIDVRDRLLGGWQTPLIGTTYVPLEDRIEFGPDDKPNPLYRKFRKPQLGNPYLDFEASYAKKKASARRQAKKGGSRADMHLELSKGIESMVSVVGQNAEEEDEYTQVLKAAFEMDEEAYQKATPAWKEGRDTLPESWEEHAGEKCPFETFTLYKGQVSLDSEHESTREKVGILKGIIRVLDDPSPNMKFIDSLQKAITVQCRLYVLQGSSLVAKDDESSDPFIKVKLGDKELGDRESAQYKTLHPAFFHRYDFTTTLPGVSQLKISCWDKDVLFDELIGETVIDVEDRWFNSFWRYYLGPKPIETRTLWSESATLAQGSLTCWLDIVNREEARTYPPIEIAPPPNAEYEVRMVIWKTMNIPAGDEFENMSDQYVTCQLGPDEKNTQNTDMHLRSQDGKGSFNWRMKFMVKLPIKSEGGSNLKIQVYDKDIFQEDDLLCESNFDLSVPFKKAAMDPNIKKTPFQVFKTIEQIRADREAKKQVQTVTSPTGSVLNVTSPLLSPSNSMAPANPGSNEHQSDTTPLLQQGGSSLQQGSLNNTAEPTKKVKKNQKNTLWHTLKEQSGMGPDPDYSAWLKLDKTDKFKDSQGQPMVLVSIEIMTKEIAELMKAGNGRESPNQFPVLPPPKGRIDFTKMFNPFYLIQTMCGTSNCAKIFGALCLMISIVLLIFIGPFFMDIVEIILELPSAIQYTVMIAIPVCLICGLCVIMRDCASFCGCGDPCPKMCGRKKIGPENV